MSFFAPVRTMENNPTSSGDVPVQAVVITACGELSPDDPSLTAEPRVDGDPYEEYPEDEQEESQSPEGCLRIAKDIREIGNKLFKAGKLSEALAKYQSMSYLIYLAFTDVRGRIYQISRPVPGVARGCSARVAGFVQCVARPVAPQ